MIYFDNAATTSPITAPQVFHNPSSPHALGIKAERALRHSRKIISNVLSSPSCQAAPEEIIFTSGGTESNNLAILGYSLSNMRHNAGLASAPHEHPSILAPIRFAQEQNWAHATSLGTSSGPVLVCISHVNHETGDINDIEAIAADIKKNNPASVIFVDGSQGFCKEKISLRNIDMYSFSGHKCHGPIGTGGLWVKKGLRLTPLQHGGGQEDGRRSGTENVPAIIQMAEAADIMHKNFTANHDHVAKIKLILLSLKDSLPNVEINSLSGHVTPYILNMSFLGIKGEILVHALSEKNIYVSMGAACRSRKRAKPALELMGFAPEIAASAIRFSFSPCSTLQEAEQALPVIIQTVNQLRRLIR